ncbi:MAG: glycosyltransferase family 39 protein [Candidatus Dojkabacteria bacterium]
MLNDFTNSMWEKIIRFIKNPLFLLALIIALAIVLRVLEIDKTSFWYDEAFTGNTLKFSWAGMFDVIKKDMVHPPLFYILARLWTEIFGATQFSLRSFSIFLGVGTISLAYLFGKKMFDKNRYPILGLLLAFVIAISPFFVTYSIEARAYSLISLLALGLGFSVIKWLDSKEKKERNKYLVLSVLLSITLCATHYLQLVYIIAVLCAIFIYKFVYRENGVDKKWLSITIGIVLLTISIFLFVPLKEFLASYGMGSMPWIPEIKMYELLRVYYSYFLGVVRYISGVPPVRELPISIPTLVFGGVMFLIHTLGYIYILISKSLSREDKRHISFFFLLGIITFLGFYMVGLLGFNCFVERYTIAGGIIVFTSFWTVIVTVLRSKLLVIPIGLYILLILMLKPMIPMIDYRELAKNLDTLDNSKRYVFTSALSFVNTKFYMSHTNLYYFYDFEGEYDGWAILKVAKGLSIKEIEKGDALVVSSNDTERFLKLGYTQVATVGGDSVVLEKGSTL